MPSRIYLTSADEFVVTMSFANAIAALDEMGLVEFTVVRWRDPEGPAFDEHSDLPTITETPLVVRASHLMAIGRCEDHEAQGIERAREHQHA